MLLYKLHINLNLE